MVWSWCRLFQILRPLKIFIRLGKDLICIWHGRHTLCFPDHFAAWNTLLPRSRVFQEAKCAGEQNVSVSKVFQGSKCFEEQNTLRSKLWVCKVFWGAKCSGEQSVCQPWHLEQAQNLAPIDMQEIWIGKNLRKNLEDSFFVSIDIFVYSSGR